MFTRALIQQIPIAIAFYTNVGAKGGDTPTHVIAWLQLAMIELLACLVETALSRPSKESTEGDWMDVRASPLALLFWTTLPKLISVRMDLEVDWQSRRPAVALLTARELVERNQARKKGDPVMPGYEADVCNAGTSSAIMAL